MTLLFWLLFLLSFNYCMLVCLLCLCWLLLILFRLLCWCWLLLFWLLCWCWLLNGWLLLVILSPCLNILYLTINLISINNNLIPPILFLLRNYNLSMFYFFILQFIQYFIIINLTWSNYEFIILLNWMVWFIGVLGMN